MSQNTDATPTGEEQQTTVDVSDQIDAGINEILPDEYDAIDLLEQADVWLRVDYWPPNQLRISVDFDKLEEWTDYEGGADAE